MVEKDPQFVSVEQCLKVHNSVDVRLAKIETLIAERSKHQEDLIKIVGITVTLISVAAAIINMVLQMVEESETEEKPAEEEEEFPEELPEE